MPSSALRLLRFIAMLGHWLRRTLIFYLYIFALFGLFCVFFDVLL
ncbi:hypothetical protein YPPY95_0055 [Yersinia pestis PY-95]|nr:hypothetical protein YPPY95_0055 [Yersinia pestis PY-95]